MARVAINTGASANDGTGDNLRAAGGILNNNFLELYTYLGAGSTTVLSAPLWSSTNAGINTLSKVGIGTTNPRFALEVGAVGASGTTLFVNGDARVTGIVTIGPASITLNGITNIINVGTGITINGSTGIISATAIVLGGTTLTGAAVTFITAGSGISVNQGIGNVTITATGTGSTSQWVTTAAGIHTLSNVGIGTTNPTSALTVSGNGTFTGVVTATTFIGALTGTATTATNAQGLTGTPNITVGVATASTLNVGTGGTVITTTTAGLVGIGTTNPTSKLTVSGDALINGLTVGLGSGAITSNTAIGSSALYSNTTGYQNTANGQQALGLNTTGNYNTANGYRALYSNTTGTENTANGVQALYSNTTGDQNTATGYSALYTNTTGSYNTGIGFESLESNITANSNTGIGYRTLFTNRYGTKNVAIGLQSLILLDGGGYNTATGSESLSFVVTGANNTATGYGSLNETTASNNTGIGYLSGSLITTGSKNTLLGSYTGNQNGLDIRTSSNNVVLSDGDGNIRFYANSSGNVGLGTTNPTSALTVVGASGTTLLVAGGTIPIQIGGNNVSGTIFKVGEINLSGPDVSDVNATYYSNIRYDKVGDFRYNLEFHSGGYTGYGGAAPAGGPGDFIFYKRDISYGRAERFRISGETGNITAQGGVIATSTNVSGISTLGTVQISSGIVTATSGIVTYYGDTSNAADGRWTLGANGSSDYTFVGIGFTQTTNDPVLYLARGRVYEFVNNSGGSHPFQIRVSNGGAAYSDGVTNNGGASGVIRFEIPFSAPNTLYYQCTNHSGMGNTISVYPNTI